MQMGGTSAGVVDSSDSIPLSYLTRANEVLLEQGKDISPYLAACGLTLKDLDSVGVEVSSQQYYALMDRLLEQENIPALGVQVGRKFSVADYGVLGYAFISSQTLLQAMTTFLRFQAIVGSNAMFEETLQVGANEGVISVSCNSRSERLNRFEIEESFGQWLATAGAVSMSGASLIFSRINFVFTKPEYGDIYTQLFKCPVYFDQPANQIYFPKAMLDQRFAMANDITAQLCEQQCETILNNLQQQGGLIEDVRRLIINQPGQAPDPQEVARQLNVSYRTLRRRLSDEGTSFKDIHNEVRMGMAMEYLRQTELSTQEIAFLLGYSEATNFHRAFKKWAAQTPGEYRESERTA